MQTAGLTWRALTTADVPALTRTYEAIEAVDRTGDHYSEQDVRDELEGGSPDLAADTIAALGPGGEVVAFARLQCPDEVHDVDHVHADGGVVPWARGQGLGRRLLVWAEDRAAHLHRERHPDRPGAVRVEVHENNPSKEGLVRAAGYEAVRWEYRMTHGLDGALPTVLPAPPGLAVTPYVAERDEAVRQAHRDAFADHWGAAPPDEQRWARAYTGMRAFRPEVSWLVLEGDELAAYLLSYFWEADAAATGVRDAFVGQLGVRVGWRRRGLGALLLATALRSYRGAGYERAVLGVDTGNATGALGLYERAGFTVQSRSASWLKPLVTP